MDTVTATVDTAATATTADDSAETAEVTQDLHVEDVSSDGMCGVY